MTVDLVAFLRARLDEDEQVARATGPLTNWDVGEYGDLMQRTSPTHGYEMIPPHVVHGQTGTRAVRHIARHDPARVLAEVDAKRRIIDAHQPETRTVLDGANMPSTHEFCDTCTEWIYPCETLRLLALPYADHPGYHREEWAP